MESYLTMIRRLVSFHACSFFHIFFHIFFHMLFITLRTEACVRCAILLTYDQLFIGSFFRLIFSWKIKEIFTATINLLPLPIPITPLSFSSSTSSWLFIPLSAQCKFIWITLMEFPLKSLCSVCHYCTELINFIIYWTSKLGSASSLTNDSEFNSVDENISRFLSLGHETVAFIDTTIIFSDFLQHQGTVSLSQIVLQNIHTTLKSFTLVRVRSCSLKHSLKVSLPFNTCCSAGHITPFTRQDSCVSHSGRYSDQRVYRRGVCEVNQWNT